MKNYFIRHYMSPNSGWGKDIESHQLWLMCGDKEPGSIDEYNPEGKTFRFCHVANSGEGIFFYVRYHKILRGNEDRPHDFNDYDRGKAFLLQICKFLNSGKTLKDTKGFFYISEFKFPGNRRGEENYALNLIRSDEERPNETRSNSGGFINTATGDTHLFEFFCFGKKMRDKRKKLMQQICSACNQGLIEF